MRIELLVFDKGSKVVNGKKPTYQGFIFTDASPDLDLAFNARFWEAGAVVSARVLMEGGWQQMKRAELEKLLTKDEDPERARKRAEKEEAASSHETVDMDALREQISREMKDTLKSELMADIEASLRKKFAAENDAKVAAAVKAKLEEAEMERATRPEGSTTGPAAH